MLGRNNQEEMGDIARLWTQKKTNLNKEQRENKDERGIFFGVASKTKTHTFYFFYHHPIHPFRLIIIPSIQHTHTHTHTYLIPHLSSPLSCILPPSSSHWPHFTCSPAESHPTSGLCLTWLPRLPSPTRSCQRHPVPPGQCP